MNTQMLKGLLEGALLLMIKREKSYSYELKNKLKIEGFGDISEGTIYPLLLRLEKQKMIIGEQVATGTGPNRKYYSLTTEGEKYLEDFLEDWSDISQAMKALVGE